VSVRTAIVRAMHARYGTPRKVRPDVVDGDGAEVVRVYAVRDREAADAFVMAERVTWGNPARAELRESLGWCVIVDLRHQIEAHRRAHPLPRPWS
jgi:hypothetical protein